MLHTHSEKKTRVWKILIYMVSNGPSFLFVVVARASASVCNDYEIIPYSTLQFHMQTSHDCVPSSHFSPSALFNTLEPVRII